MKKLGLVVLGVVAAVSLNSSVFAEDGQVQAPANAPRGGGPAQRLERFKKADTNNDGKLSLDEFKAAFTKGDSEKKFADADANKDGFITPDELKVAHGRKPVAPLATPVPATPAK